MTQEIAYRFIEALAALEQRGQIDPMLEVFSEACDLGNSSPREYWTNYRSGFRDIHSTINNIITGDHSIALEWTARATDHAGKESQYQGVSILDTRGPSIVRFRAYKQAASKIPPKSAQQTEEQKWKSQAS